MMNFQRLQINLRIMKVSLMEPENLAKWTRATTKGGRFTMLMQMQLLPLECFITIVLDNAEESIQSKYKHKSVIRVQIKN